MNALRRILTALLIMSATLVAVAQEAPYKFDFGGAVGVTGYLGEANTSPLLKHPGFSAELSARYFPNVRWAFRGMLNMATLSGDTKDMENYIPGEKVYIFTSSLFGAEVRSEFNFLPFGIGETYKQLSRWSPYLTVGLGVAVGSGDADVPVALELPMGFGVKYKMSQRMNLWLEISMTKVFSDKVDHPGLSDITGIKTSFFKNTDWYSRLSVGISYEFGERCQTCHYVD